MYGCMDVYIYITSARERERAREREIDRERESYTYACVHARAYRAQKPLIQEMLRKL